jgi:hypothetical protein
VLIDENSEASVPSLVKKNVEVVARGFDIAKVMQWLADKVLPTLSEKFPERVEAIKGSFADIATTIVVACEELDAADGVVSKFGVIGSAIEDISAGIEKISKIEPIPGEVKKEIVTTIVIESYEVVDKGWDGSHNRIQLTKYIPAAVSDAIERMLLKLGVGLAINAAVSAWHRYGEK